MIELTEEQEALASELTWLQKKFAINMVGSNNQREAYVDAGGKAKTPESQDSTASEIFSRPKVRAFYDSLLASMASKSILTRTEALEILTENARTADDNRDKHTAIKQLSSMEGWDSPKKFDVEIDGRITVKRTSKRFDGKTK